MYYLVAPIKTFHSSESLLTYHFSPESLENPYRQQSTPDSATQQSPHSPKKLLPGHLVEIPLGRNNQKTVALVVKATKKPAFDTKNILRLIHPLPLPTHLVEAILWLSTYYHTPLSTALSTALPRGVEKNRRQSKDPATLTLNTFTDPQKPTDLKTTPPLTSAQSHAVHKINTNHANTVLLHGITGSGKTTVYLTLAEKYLQNHQSVILLVPEIALTSQLVQNFQSHFANTPITLLHSAQTEALRHRLWLQILETTQPQIVIGPRSALFAPIANLGLIIIDEAHEPAYHQDQNPKYSALRLASKITASLAKQHIPPKTILGTATPLISDYYLCQKNHALVTLDQLALQTDKTTKISLIDLKNRPDFTKSRLLSNQLITSIQHSLDTKTQSLVFHNRRGTAPLTICDHCGWQALCDHCFLPLTLHADDFQMRCHTCGKVTKVPTSCPDCGNADIHHKGFGTKLLESELKKFFPNATISRFDADTDHEKQLHKTYDEVRSGNVDIIIGTQMIAKGFDFPKLTTLGVAQADAGLALPDFASEERTFQLITQVIGRAKRGHQNSSIFIQTYQPEHPIISYALKSDYTSLYNYLIKKRQKTLLPPYTFLLKLSLTYKTESATIRNLRLLHRQLLSTSKSLSISPPMPAFHERSPKGYTWQIIIKSKSRQSLLTLLDTLPKNPHLHFDLDPLSLL